MVRNSWSCFAIESLWVQYEGTDFDIKTKKALGKCTGVLELLHITTTYKHSCIKTHFGIKIQEYSRHLIYLHYRNKKSVILKFAVIYRLALQIWFIYLPFKISTFITVCRIFHLAAHLAVTSWYNDKPFIHLESCAALQNINYCTLYQQPVSPGQSLLTGFLVWVHHQQSISGLWSQESFA